MNRVFSILLLVGFSLSGFAQKNRTSYYEFGAGLGSWNMSNELANSGSVGAFFNEIRPQLTAFTKYHFNDWFALGAEMSYGQMFADDANHDNFDRGLSVNTRLFGSFAFTEIHLIRFGKYHYDRKFTIFLKGGAGFNTWNPELELSNRIPEGIDIETNAYSAFGYYSGFGFKIRSSYRSILSFEARFYNSGGDTMEGFTLTNTGVPGDNDTYAGMLFSYSYMIF